MKSTFMTTHLDPGTVCDLLRAAAREHILPYFGVLKPHQINFKDGNPDNKVTVADTETETYLAPRLQSLIPGSFVVGEEGCAADPAAEAHLSDSGKTVWVIDPVDGTGNFARGSKMFCVMVALAAGGQTRMGWIYDVCNDSMAFAEKGKGAFLDGERLTLARTGPRESLSGFTGYKRLESSGNPRLTAYSLRCAGHEYLRLARGQEAFSVYGAIKPWDHLAGTLLVEEAGGIARKWDGSPYAPADGEGGLITADSPDTWQTIRKVIPAHILERHGIKPAR